MESKGHIVADDPGGFEAVAEDPGGTVVVGFHLYIPIYRRVLDFESGDMPRVFVGTGWDVWDQYVFSPPPRTSLRSSILRHRHVYP